MSKQANPTLIGTFVLFGLAVAIAAIMVLGKFNFKDDTVRCVAYFSGSLHGLDIGAPVTFRGVSVGRVSDIQLQYDKKSENYVIPVFIEIDQQVRPEQGSKKKTHAEMQRSLDALIAQGLQAQMKTSSLLTGKLYVDLALTPNEKPVLHGTDGDYLEIPTLASGIDKIAEKLESLPLEEIVSRAADALDNFNKLMSSDQTGEALRSLSSAMQNLDSILKSVNTDLPGLVTDLRKGIKDFSASMAEANKLLQSADKGLGPLSGEMQQLLVNLNKNSEHLSILLQEMNGFAAKDSAFSYQLQSSLREMEQAASSVRDLTDYLLQNPNSLIFGNKGNKEAQ